jgi:hypothetical protein
MGNASVAAMDLGSGALAQLPATIDLARFSYFYFATVRAVYETLSAQAASAGGAFSGGGQRDETA